MSDSLKNPALLANLCGPSLAPVALNISGKYQFCVDAGASAALGFFDDLTAVGLHDHIAVSMHVFQRSVRAASIASETLSGAAMQACSDAFAAGYLGRIQQELRLFHGEDCRTGQHDAMGPPGPSAMH